MNDLLRTRMFRLLAESSPVPNEEMQSAYEDFMKHTQTLSQSDNDFAVIYRTLNLTRIEFKTLQTQILYEQGEKCASKSVFSESNMVS